MICTMFKLDSEEALRAAFRPKDRSLVELSPEVTLPRIVRDYVAWTHPAGGRVYVVFAVAGGAPTGIVFDTNGGSGETVPQLCDWCHTPGAGTQVALLTAKLHGKKRVGVHLCSDLSCREKLQDAADRAGASASRAVAGVVERMARFASEALKMDLTGKAR